MVTRTTTVTRDAVVLVLGCKMCNWHHTNVDVSKGTHFISRTEPAIHIFWLQNSRSLPKTCSLSVLRCPFIPWHSKRLYRNLHTDFDYLFLNLELHLSGRFAQGEASEYKRLIISVPVLIFLLLPFSSSFHFFCSLISPLSISKHFLKCFVKHLKVFHGVCVCFIFFYFKTWRILCIALWAIYG